MHFCRDPWLSYFGRCPNASVRIKDLSYTDEYFSCWERSKSYFGILEKISVDRLRNLEEKSTQRFFSPTNRWRDIDFLLINSPRRCARGCIEYLDNGGSWTKMTQDFFVKGVTSNVPRRNLDITFGTPCICFSSRIYIEGCRFIELFVAQLDVVPFPGTPSTSGSFSSLHDFPLRWTHAHIARSELFPSKNGVCAVERTMTTGLKTYRGKSH